MIGFGLHHSGRRDWHRQRIVRAAIEHGTKAVREMRGGRSASTSRAARATVRARSRSNNLCPGITGRRSVRNGFANPVTLNETKYVAASKDALSPWWQAR